MFRITCLVEDKRLAEVLRGLADKVVEMEPPAPLRGLPGFENGDPPPSPGIPLTPGTAHRVAVPQRDFVPGPKSHATNPGRKPLEDIRKHIKKGAILDTAGISGAIVQIGWAPGSFSYAIKKAIKAKILRRVGSGQYEVI